MKNTIKNFKRILVAILLLILICPAVPVEAKANSKSSVKTVVIDPSCQKTANTKKEAIGPGDFNTTEQSPSGEVGTSSEYTEYEMNLQIALKLQTILKDQGYNVLLTRTDNDVDISNSGRAMIANTADADIFVVINASEDAGIEITCQSKDNPYNYGNYENARLLSDALLGSVLQSTQSNNGDVVESDEKAAINWCAVPTSIVSVGALTDLSDEEKLVTNQYQQLIAQGIANGIDSYFTQK